MVQPSSIWEQDQALLIKASNQQNTDLETHFWSPHIIHFSAIVAKKRKNVE